MSAFQNRKPKASFNETPSSGNRQPNNNNSNRSNERGNYSQPQREEKPVWLTLGNIVPTRKLMENSEVYQDVVAYLRDVGATFLWDTWFGKTNPEFNLLHKDNILLNFRTYEDDKPWVVGRVSMRDGDNWINLGKISATKKGTEGSKEYAELAEGLKTSGFTFNMKIWLKDKDDTFTIEAKSKLLLCFKQTEGDKDFVIGSLLFKG